MTLNQLSERLKQIIDENNGRGWAARNDLPVVISIYPAPRKKGQHHKDAKHFAVRYASNAMHTIPAAGGKAEVMCLITNETDKI